MKPPEEADLDHAVIVGWLYLHTPDLAKLRSMADEIAKESSFTSNEILQHIQKRVTEALAIVARTENDTRTIGFKHDE